MIEAAFDAYRARLRSLVEARTVAAHGRRGLTSPRLCMVAWPPSLADVAPATCQLPRGHHSAHRHVPAGYTVGVEWR